MKNRHNNFVGVNPVMDKILPDEMVFGSEQLQEPVEFYQQPPELVDESINRERPPFYPQQQSEASSINQREELDAAWHPNPFQNALSYRNQ